MPCAQHLSPAAGCPCHLPAVPAARPHMHFKFFWYDQRIAAFQFKKRACGKGQRVIVRIVENRELFTYVPWCDANGEVLFCQLIYKGKEPLTGHISDLLKSAPILLQYSECGVQTGKTWTEALQYLRERHSEFHDNDPEICDGVLVFTTDGHASRYDVAALDKCADLNIRPNIRVGGSSFLTQMWDQIFDKFTVAYTQYALQVIELWKSVPTDDGRLRSPLNTFSMTKRMTMSIVATMHKGGRCTWASPGKIIEAWSKVGITARGVEVVELLANSLITGAVAKDTKFKKGGLPPTLALQPKPITAKTPEKLASKQGRRTKAYHEFNAARLQELVNWFTWVPPNLFDYGRKAAEISSRTFTDGYAVYRSGLPDEGESGMKRVTINSETGDILRKVCRARQFGDRNTPVPPALQPYFFLAISCNQCNSAFNNNPPPTMQGSQLVAAKKKRQAEDVAAATDAKKKRNEKMALRTAFLLCRATKAAGHPCHCPTKPCVMEQYNYCKECDDAGRPAVQKSRCNKKVCANARLEVSHESAAAPATD